MMPREFTPEDHDLVNQLTQVSRMMNPEPANGPQRSEGRMMPKLLDITEMPACDLAAYQMRMSAAGEMKTAIKRFLDDFGSEGNAQYRRRTAALREAMEAFCNATGSPS